LWHLFKTPLNLFLGEFDMINKKSLTLLGSLAVLTVPQAFALPSYVVPTGATSCIQCHDDNFGKGFKTGVLQAAASPLGKIPGLTAYIKSLSTPVIPTPVTPTGTDTKPVIHPINPEWNVTVGESQLIVPLRVSDAEDDSFSFKGSMPQGAAITAPATDAQSTLPMSLLLWSPTASQAGKSYTVSVTANEIGTGRTLVSSPVTATIKVWPARATTSKNVTQLLLDRAQWNNNQLLLTGKLLFKAGLTTDQRAAALASLRLNLKSSIGIAIGSPLALAVDNFGNWKQILTLNASQVPCVAKVDYEGLVAVRTVKLAPASTCIK
jgi:hypothetical protein